MKSVIKLKKDAAICKNCPSNPFSEDSKKPCPYFKKFSDYLKSEDITEIDYISCSKKDLFTHNMSYHVNFGNSEEISSIDVLWKREGSIGFRNCYVAIVVKNGPEKGLLEHLIQTINGR